ncbi:MAG: prepilin-type N-terminal cleavage/methylation domain-containing protein [Phycisphaerales bacterium]|jgi:prepilin-type N-terminal cleavage/methylation domain-containing protein
MNRNPRPILRRCGFTLIELLVAISASTVLISAMGSLIVLTSTALPSGDDRGSVSAGAAHTVQRIADDLTYATAVTPASGSLRLVVPDRTGDSQPESVVYWLASGQVLKRGTSTSDTSAVTLLTGVSGFVTERDSGVGVIRAVRIELTVDGLGTVQTSVETVARPAG